MRMFREARPAPTVHADTRPGRPRYTAPHEAHAADAAQDDADGEDRTGYAVRGRALALRAYAPRRRRHLSAEAVRHEGGKVSPGPPARKDNLRFSTSRKRNPSLSLVDARRRCRRTRRAWSPQCDPRRRPGRRSPGPASSLSAGGATPWPAVALAKAALPPARSPVLLPDPHADEHRAGYAVRGRGAGAVAPTRPGDTPARGGGRGLPKTGRHETAAADPDAAHRPARLFR